ncbi:MAG: sugar ABC transporter permease [Candidatus Omnitrophica bacterium]|nr:sugar ABC transporter permease [Candidatus Omnitrophota bacterium]
MSAETLTAQPKPRALVVKDNLKNLAFVLPAVIIFSVFYVYPFFEIFRLSLQSWDGISPTSSWVGLANFTELMRDKIWWSSMWHAAYITLIALTFQNALAFALALACDREIRMQRFYRVVFFLPPVLSEVVVGMIWQWILNSDVQGGQPIGVLNYWLTQMGLPQLVHHWLSDPQTALTCIAVVHCWKGFGWGFIMLLAGLQTIDHQLYEAAKVDGANSWHTFRHVTLPMMVPVISVVMILTILGSMQVFILIKAMVSQGLGYHTEVPVTRILLSMQESGRFGYACAMGVTFGVFLIGLSLASKLLSGKTKQ